MSKLRDKALNALDVRKESVTVPEWDGAVIELRGLGIAALNKIRRASRDASGEIDPGMLAVLTLIASAHDPEDGSKVFSEGDIEVLGEKSERVLQRLLGKVSILCGFGDQEEAEKNSETMPSVSDSSESLAISE